MIAMRFQEMRGNFFDRKVVKDQLDAKARKAHSKFGAFVRQRAKTSLRYGTGVSSPGRPPIIHKTALRKKRNKKTNEVKVQGVSPLREFMFFVWDNAAQSVVIGPALLNGTRGGAQALAALEWGGQSTVKAASGEVKSIHVEARPNIGPAFAAEIKNLPPLWQG